MFDLEQTTSSEYATSAQFLQWQSDSVDRIAQLNLGYLAVTVTIVLFVAGIVQFFSYKNSKDELRKLETTIKSDIESSIKAIEKKIITEILGPPRVGRLVKINDTIFLVEKDGMVGFSNPKAVIGFGYKLSDAELANPQEQALQIIGVINERDYGFPTPREQALAQNNLDKINNKITSP